MRISKTPFDILDDIYSLAYWMTGSERASEELVLDTYRKTEAQSEETELLKRFRNIYVDRYGQHAELTLLEQENGKSSAELHEMKNRAADVKLAVLLAAITGMKHRQISDILGKPVETVRTWLFWGRKALVLDGPLKASA